MSSTEERAAKVLEELAAKAKPGDLDKLDDSFADRVERLAVEQKLDEETVERLHAMWKMLKADDEVVPWSSKALIMAAISYFASPLDLLPDFVGKKGYADDIFVIRLAFERLGDATREFR